MPTAKEKFRSLLKTHSEYTQEAYNFIYEILEYTLRRLNRLPGNGKKGRVNTGSLLESFRLHSIEQFGCLAKTVLNELGIRTTNDIGNIAFNLVEYDLMGKQKRDKKEDFNNVYDFDKVFDLKQKILYDYEREEWEVEYIQKE